MRFLLNVVWLLFAGFWLALAYALAALLSVVFVVTIPFALPALRLAGYALWPFGRVVVTKPSAGTGSAVVNVVWFLVAGWWLALAHVLSAAALAATIIGIPLALADLKMALLAVAPYGRQVVDRRSIPPSAEIAHAVVPRSRA